MRRFLVLHRMDSTSGWWRFWRVGLSVPKSIWQIISRLQKAVSVCETLPRCAAGMCPMLPCPNAGMCPVPSSQDVPGAAVPWCWDVPGAAVPSSRDVPVLPGRAAGICPALPCPSARDPALCCPALLPGSARCCRTVQPGSARWCLAVQPGGTARPSLGEGSPGGESGAGGRERGIHRRRGDGTFLKSIQHGPSRISRSLPLLRQWGATARSFPEVNLSFVNRKGKEAPPTQFPSGRMEGKRY